MTQDQFDNVADEIVQEQQQLDEQQGLGDQSAQLTEDRVRQMLNDQFQALRREVSGLQSGWDRGLNAIRGDMRKEIDQRLSDMNAQAGREAFLGSLDDPEERRKFEYILQNQDNQARHTNNGASQEQQIQEQQTAQQQAYEQQIYNYVRARNVAVNDPRVNYNVLVDPNMSWEQRQQIFYDSVESARVPAQTTSQQQPSQGTAQRPPSNTVNPPVDGGGRGSGNGGTREDADLNMYLTNKIDREEFLKRQPQFRR
jgi:hypothetical protein